MNALHALTPEKLIELTSDVKRALTQVYGPRLERLVLYGSYARGQANAYSDVDFLAVLREDEIQYGDEVRTLVDVTYPFCDQYNVLVSVKPTSLRKYLQADTFFYENVRRDQIVL